MARGRTHSTENVNVSWVEGRNHFLWLFYALCVASFRLGVSFLPIDAAWCWTTTSLAHAVVTFAGLHLSKGTPVWVDQGAYNNDTFWEQLDDGVPWTRAKKILLIIPVIIFLIASHATNYELPHLAINSVVVMLLIIPKLPEMHHVRLFGSKDE